MTGDVTLDGTAMSGASISAINPVSARVYEVTITPPSAGMKGDLDHIGASGCRDRYRGECQHRVKYVSDSELQSERTHGGNYTQSQRHTDKQRLI